MSLNHRIVQFRAADPSEVVAEIDRIADRGDQQEWVTISPWVDVEEVPRVHPFARLFSGRGPKIPEVTWVPAAEEQLAEVGVLHALGPHALPRLRDDGFQPPAGWTPTQDHSRRGILFTLPPGTDGRAIVNVAMVLCVHLAAVPIDDRWVSRLSIVS